MVSIENSKKPIINLKNIKKTLVHSIICSKCKNEDEKYLKKKN